MATRIGVSGDRGSFSEEAGLLYAMRIGLEPEIIHSIDMEGVLSKLDEGAIELGIFPVVNSRGGLVQTAFEAIGRHLFQLEDELWMEIHHCMLVVPGVVKEDLKQIATHPQSFSQCERHLRREYNGLRHINWEDTAKAAKDLAQGVLSRDTAVIAPTRSAQIYNLEILEKGIQDNYPNLTTFIIVKK